MNLAADIPRWHFTADQVLEMVERGILRRDDPVELIDGELVEVSPQGPEHRSVSAWIHRKLDRAYAVDHHVRSKSTIQAGHDSLPEPDVAVVRGLPGDYRRRLPSGADLVLVVEVSLSSQVVDRAKAAVYARAGVPEYWQLDVAARCLRLHRRPTSGGEYGETQVLGEDDEVALPALEIVWKVRELLL